MRNFAYGGLAPIESTDLIRTQLQLAHTYQKVLVLIERKRREVVNRLYRTRACAEWLALERAVQKVVEAVKAVRMMRNRPDGMLEPDEETKEEAKAETKLRKEALDAARETEKAARAAWWAAKKLATPVLKKRLQMCDRGAYARAKLVYARAGSVGLAWGTRLKVGEWVERAGKAAAKEGEDVMPHLPRFDGCGTLAVQLQGESGIAEKFGLSIPDALSGKDTRFQLISTTTEDWLKWRGKNKTVSVRKDGRVFQLEQANPSSKRSQKRAGCETIVRLRIGSNGRQPIFAAWPVILHRPLPADSVIKWVQMHSRRVGPRVEWQLIVTVDEPAVAAKPLDKILAVNLGWRNLLDGGIRVAYAVGNDGRREEVRVPPAYVEGVKHVDTLKSTRDKMFEDAKTLLRHAAEEQEVPDWFERAAQNSHFWKSPKRLVFLLRDWGRQRFVGDARLWNTFEQWNKQDRHLWFWESDERAKLLHMRKDAYRKVAARWATEYSRIIVTDMDLRDFAEGPEPEKADSTGGVQRKTRFLAAPSEMRGAVKNACSTRGTAFEEVEGKFKTQTCNECGIVFAFDAKQNLEHTCECGVRWDQDYNHCVNLLRNQKRKKDEAAPKKSRWAKKREKISSSEVVNESASSTSGARTG